MMRVTRRDVLALCAGGMALVLGSGLPASAADEGWIEVVGMAPEGPQAHRQALADAILAAALAGGAEVRGHSAMNMARVTSDIMVVQPTGRVIAHRVVNETVSQGIRRVTIKARVARNGSSLCGAGRRLDLTIYPPTLRVAADAPAWAEVLVQSVAADMVVLAENHAAVAAARRVARRPTQGRNTDYATLISGSGRVAPGGHALEIGLSVARNGNELRLTTRLALQGSASDSMEKTHIAAVPVPDLSLFDRAAPPRFAGRGPVSAKLAAGAAPALDQLLARAGCSPVVAQATVRNKRLIVPVGRLHGLTRTSLAATSDDMSQFPDLVEVVRLSDTEAELRPLDVSRPVAGFGGRVFRFIDSVVALP